MSLDRNNPDPGYPPSLPPVKYRKMPKPEPSIFILNSAPYPELPPPIAAPYIVFPDKTKSPFMDLPSLFLLPPKVALLVCKTVKALPSMLILNIVPFPKKPPPPVTPYKVLPTKSNPGEGFHPSLLVYTPDRF